MRRVFVISTRVPDFLYDPHFPMRSFRCLRVHLPASLRHSGVDKPSGLSPTTSCVDCGPLTSSTSNEQFPLFMSRSIWLPLKKQNWHDQKVHPPSLENIDSNQIEQCVGVSRIRGSFTDSLSSPSFSFKNLGTRVLSFQLASMRIIARVIFLDFGEALTYLIEGGNKTQRKKRQNNCFKGRLCETLDIRVSHIFFRLSSSVQSRLLSISKGV